MQTRIRITTILMTVALVSAVSTIQAVARDGPSTLGSGGVRPNALSKSKVKQDPAFLAAKNSGSFQASSCTPNPCPPAPSAYTLSTAVTQYIIEPEGGTSSPGVCPNPATPIERDDNSPRTGYCDTNYWLFCTAGASATTLYYWKPNNVTGWGAGYFIEPYGPQRVQTYWGSSDTDYRGGYYTNGRAYLMYLAEQVFPNGNGWTTPGVVNFNPPVSGSLNDVRDVLNWEASSHAGNWVNYFYVTIPNASLTEAALHYDVKEDTWSFKAPVVVFANTSYLPGWILLNVTHAISVIGYNDTTHTYTYVDTCGAVCGSGSNTSVHTIDQTTLFNGIHATGTYGGIVW